MARNMKGAVGGGGEPAHDKREPAPKHGPTYTFMDKIFETNFSFYVKQGTTGKIQFLFFRNFLLVLKRFSFWEKS